jgi:hypothetical protein
MASAADLALLKSRSPALLALYSQPAWVFLDGLPREAFGVRGACSRFLTIPHLTKAPATWTHSKRFAHNPAAPSSIASLRLNGGAPPQSHNWAKAEIRKRAAQSHPRLPQSHSKATYKPYTLEYRATPRPPQGYPKATPRLPQGHPKATPRPPQGYPKATPRPPQGYTKAIPEPGESGKCWGRLGGRERLSGGRLGEVFGVLPLLLPTLRPLSLFRFGLVSDYQYGRVKVWSLRMMIGSLSFAAPVAFASRLAPRHCGQSCAKAQLALIASRPATAVIV